MPALRIEDHMGLLKSFARRAARRAMAAGSTATFEDILSECGIAWCIARNNWDETQGVPFVAYLMGGVRNHVNRFVDKEITQHNGSHMDLDAEFTEDSDDGHGIIADSNAVSPEDEILLKDRREKALARLSPRARQFVELIEAPPKCLVDIVNALAERRQFAIERGVNAAGAPKRVMPAMVFRFMGCSRLEQMRIGQELEKKFNIKAALAEIDRVN